MAPADAAAMLQQWFTAHLRTVGRALAWFGISSRDDRSDLTQDVFFAAYLALLRDEPIENPRAWLRECARKHAGNHRQKEQRRRSGVGAPDAGNAPDPEQITADRARLRRAFASLDEDAQDLVFDVRADEVSWTDVARERGITVNQARYLYHRALTQMEEVLKRDDSDEKERRSIGPPVTVTVAVAVALDQLERALRADADDVSPDTRRRIWDSLEQRIESTLVHTVDPGGPGGSGHAAATRSLPRAPVPRLEIGATLGLLGGGMAIGIVIGYLLRGPLPRLASTAPALTGQASIIAPSAAWPEASVAPILAPIAVALPSPDPPPTAIASSPRRDEPSFPQGSAIQSTSATARAKAPSGAGSMALLDRARAAVASGEALAAVDLIAQHARRFPGGQDSGARRELQKLACAMPAARAAPECVGVVVGAPPD
ncbi:MAG: hypothetical protein ABJE95_28475 [Byssovorax sp.]